MKAIIRRLRRLGERYLVPTMGARSGEDSVARRRGWAEASGLPFEKQPPERRLYSLGTGLLGANLMRTRRATRWAEAESEDVKEAQVEPRYLPISTLIAARSHRWALSLSPALPPVLRVLRARNTVRVSPWEVRAVGNSARAGKRHSSGLAGGLNSSRRSCRSSRRPPGSPSPPPGAVTGETGRPIPSAPSSARFLETLPPEQKPVTPVLPVQSPRPFSQSAAATISSNHLLAIDLAEHLSAAVVVCRETHPSRSSAAR
jgi:hypothetical protein